MPIRTTPRALLTTTLSTTLAVTALAALTACGTEKAPGAGRPGPGTVTTDTPLVGTEWQVTGLRSAGTDTALPKAARDRARVVLHKDGRVDARLGCNTGSTKATVEGDRISFGRLITTRMGCFGPAADLEKAMTSALDGEVHYVIKGDRLTLTTKDGKGVTLTAKTP
ncbi:META domain-containing protein [Streptomyces sp. NPDC050145]|uniref:META domain-containing protein n=1 Tax=Streptomyces sp. NPDC050145 TaxID=3365602 RepID=UPI0037B9EE44